VAPGVAVAVRRALLVVRRLPATLTLLLLLLIAGVAGQGLWSSFVEHPWFDAVAYGLPALEAGRWWTPLSGAFFVTHPLVYLGTIPSLLGMALLEWRRGSGRAALWFGAGQLAAVLVSAAFLLLARGLPWPWAVELAGQLDVGPSGGTMACIAAAVATLRAPWRQRAWLAVFGYALVGLLFVGQLADLEHTVAILLALLVTRSLRIQRTTIQEQRILTVGVLLALGAIQILLLLVPTAGPFGRTSPLAGSTVDAIVDAAIVLLLAFGLIRGRRWAWILAIVFAAWNVLSGVVLLLFDLADRDALVAALAGDPDAQIAEAVLWAAFLLGIIATGRAFRARPRRGLGASRPGARVSAEEVRDTIRVYGGGTLSWMSTWEGMDALRTSTGIVAFQQHAGVAIALGDPLGPEAGRARSIEEFAAAAEEQALVPCLFGASSASAAAAPADWRTLIIADDTIVDLAGLTFQGKDWARVRQSFSRAERDGVAFRLGRFRDEPFAVRQQLRAISESWVGDKDLPEMRFTLGRLVEAEDPETRLALALDAHGRVEGFLSWLPVYGGEGRVRGWTLDLMRRRDEGFPVVMEFLIGSSAAAFGADGAEFLSLSGAPLAHRADAEEGAVAQLLGGLSAALEPVYGFASLHRFKQKFNPREEPIHLLYRDEGDLPRIAAGLTRAFLPDATVRQFAAAGLGLLRRG